jgi:putative DNA methylase
LPGNPSGTKELNPCDRRTSKTHRGLAPAGRNQLHALIEKLVLWENTNSPDVLAEAHKEILDSTGGNPPTVLDPFAGGGTIPLEAQRLGLETRASDLNPVAVLINKALIEIPPNFRRKKPVTPGLADSQVRIWNNAEGLAADVRAYGQWVREEAEKRIGSLYPQARLADGSEGTSIAWIWARTVACPNPRCRIQMPLVRSWWLGKMAGKKAYVTAQVREGRVHFEIQLEPQGGGDAEGTVGRTGATCVSCGSAVELKYIRAEGRAGRMGARLMAIVAEGSRQRIYLSPTPEHEAAAQIDPPADVPDGELPTNPRDFKTPNYGMTRFSDLFTPRQLTALITLSGLVKEAREKVFADAVAASDDVGERLADGGNGAAAYADAVATYLGLAVSTLTDDHSTIVTWRPQNGNGSTRSTFARQAIPMTWDYAEANPFAARTAGDLKLIVDGIANVLELVPQGPPGCATQLDALTVPYNGALLATDPPYYNNIGYSDLSDFFYVWLRPTLGDVWPHLFSTTLVPKADELVANPYRHNGDEGARTFFQDGFATVFARARQDASADFPVTVFYAFKQSESNSDGPTSSGWETLLEGIVRSGWMVTGTWPIRSEKTGRMLSVGTNALASSVVLALRPRSEAAVVIDRRGFIAALHAELPTRLRELQHGAIAPVDLPQAAIGPGMAVFTRYAKVIESDGSAMGVRSALARINEVLDEVLSEQEGDFDATTRFAISWYRQHGYDAGVFGAADSMARARNTSVSAMERAGILTGRAGKVALLSPSTLPGSYDPVADFEISTWEVLHHLIRVLESDGVAAAGEFLAHVSSRADGGIDPALIKELAFLLFSVADTKKWAKDAIAFNNVATSWGDLIDASRSGEPPAADLTLDFTTEDEEA